MPACASQCVPCAFAVASFPSRLPALCPPCSLHHPRLFSNLVRFIVQFSLLLSHFLKCLRSNANPELRHDRPLFFFPSPRPHSGESKPPSRRNVRRNKGISRRRSNAFERLCVLVRDRLGKHTGMSNVPAQSAPESLS